MSYSTQYTSSINCSLTRTSLTSAMSISLLRGELPRSKQGIGIYAYIYIWMCLCRKPLVSFCSLGYLCVSVFILPSYPILCRIIMNRLSQENAKKFARPIGKLCHSNPGVFFATVFDRVQVHARQSMDCLYIYALFPLSLLISKSFFISWEIGVL